jgi:hypothetical protein
MEDVASGIVEGLKELPEKIKGWLESVKDGPFAQLLGLAEPAKDNVKSMASFFKNPFSGLSADKSLESPVAEKTPSIQPAIERTPVDKQLSPQVASIVAGIDLGGTIKNGGVATDRAKETMSTFANYGANYDTVSIDNSGKGAIQISSVDIIDGPMATPNLKFGQSKSAGISA